MKTDVFLKTVLCDDLHLRNICSWISTFPPEEYNLRVVCPAALVPVVESMTGLPAVADIPDNYQRYRGLVERMVGNWRGACLSNLTCFEVSRSDYFWNIDADSSLRIKDADLIDTLRTVEGVCRSECLHIASLDYHRTSNLASRLDHWSFGLAFQANDYKFIEDGMSLLTEEDFSCEWGCNIDRVLDQIRKKIKNKIKTFAILNSILIHKNEISKFEKKSKKVNNPKLKIIDYPIFEKDDYFLISKNKVIKKVMI